MIFYKPIFCENQYKYEHRKIRKWNYESIDNLAAFSVFFCAVSFNSKFSKSRFEILSKTLSDLLRLIFNQWSYKLLVSNCQLSSFFLFL